MANNEVATINEGQRMLAPAVSTSMFFDIEKFEHAQRVDKVFASSTMVPEHFRNNIGNIWCHLQRFGRVFPIHHIHAIRGGKGTRRVPMFRCIGSQW